VAVPSFSIAIFVAFATLAGCGVDAPAPRAAVDAAPRPPVRSDGRCEFDLSADKAAAVFRVLGFLDEYNGRAITEGGDSVERLYCNEGPVVDEFRNALARLSSEQGLPVSTESVVQDCLRVFQSTALTARVDSCYRYELTDEMTMPAPHGPGRRRIGHGTFNFGLFYENGGVDRVRARAYLEGAWRRWGRDGAFTFTNSSHKAEGIAFLLGQLGCTGIVVHHSVGTIPQGYQVTFTPSDDVAGWLGMPRRAK
jgi:hypothetical protein